MKEEKSEEITLENLAQMVQRGFAQTATKDDIRDLQGQITGLEGQMTEMGASLQGQITTLGYNLDVVATDVKEVKRDVQELRKESAVNEMETRDLRARMNLVEKKLGVQS